jgi:TRAP-type C4-dicarboxylate transport system permease small subunit
MTVLIASTLAYTGAIGGHISVNTFTSFLPPAAQKATQVMGNLFGLALFGLVAWQSLLHTQSMAESGDVSSMLLIPVFPFVFLVALGCGVFSLILIGSLLSIFAGDKK